MEEDHKVEGEIDGSLVEYKCVKNEKFTTVSEDRYYCPICGSRLES